MLLNLRHTLQYQLGVQIRTGAELTKLAPQVIANSRVGSGL